MRRHGLAVALGLVVLFGCDGSKPKGELPPLHPATGKVVRGGQPVTGGSLRLQADPEDPDVVVTAEVKPDGSFELQTMHAQSQKRGPGAPAGTYRVTYFPPMGDQTAGPTPEPVEVRQPQTIQAGQNSLTIDLGKK